MTTFRTILARLVLGWFVFGSPTAFAQGKGVSLLNQPGDRMAEAFGAANDEAALKFAKQVLAKSPDDADAKAVIDDLARRRKLKTFAKMPKSTPPRELDTWIKNKEFDRIIAMLEEVCAEQHGAPGGVHFHEDWRVEALIRIGEPAIPALIEVIENDKRLTRSVHWWRFGYGGNILAVREAALSATMSILRVRVFEAGFTGDNFSSRGDDAATTTARQLREYWNRFGKIPFDERMMAVIRDPMITGDRLREAVVALAYIDDKVRIGTTVWSGKTTAPETSRENPAIAKFSNPTAAEAILAAMPRDIAASDKEQDDPKMREYYRDGIAATYADALAGLGDKRIGPAVMEVAAGAKSRKQRVYFAWSAHLLGQSAEFQKIAAEVADGRWIIDSEGPEGLIASLLNMLHSSKLPWADAALASLADPKHPQSEKIVLHCTNLTYTRVYPDYVIRILRTGLDNTKMTGGKYTFDGKEMSRPNGDGFSSGPAPAEYLKDPARVLSEAPQRICDRVAESLNWCIWTLPKADPLLKDNEARMSEMKAQLARFRFRAATDEEDDIQRVGDKFRTSWSMMPDIPPLRRPATEEDVTAGRAVFSVNGTGRLAPLRLPASAIFRSDSKKKYPRSAVIVQAEIQPDGKTTYGVLVHGGIQTMDAAELTNVKPIITRKAD